MKKHFNYFRMMKKQTVFFPLFLIIYHIFCWGCANTPPPEPAEPQDLIIRQISDIPGFSKSELYEGAKKWVAGSFSDDLDVIRYSDRYKGIIVGQTYIYHVRPSKWTSDHVFECRFEIIVEVKDEKIRTTFKDLWLFHRGGTEPMLKSDMEVIRPKLENAVTALVSSYKRMNGDENW
ncbi:MAG: DUF4468 domain-containing protein [Desulfococcaceae bacterium]|nr:DUF4468 domain-containing protein [Desulfococcaceae bacterium]